jgi:hypothetical protein
MSSKNLSKISEVFNTFIEDFAENLPNFIGKDFIDFWQSSENQNKLNMLIKHKKIKMKDTIEELNEKKLQKKIKRETKIKELQSNRIEKEKSKPKSAFAFFKNDETKKIKEEFPTINKKDIHSELQKRWKKIKNTEESKIYIEKALETKT